MTEPTHFYDRAPTDPAPASDPLANAHFFAVDAGEDGVPPPLDVVERAYVARVLSHTAGRRLAAAHLLGISYPTFLKRLRELGLDRGIPRSVAQSGT